MIVSNGIVDCVRRMLTRVWILRTRTESRARTVLIFGVAFMGFVSLNPYFAWSHQKVLYGGATLIIIASTVASLSALVFTRERMLLSLGFALFLVYLSLLPKVHGGTTRWYLLIPFVVPLLHLRPQDLRSAFDMFHWMFVASLVPGMLLWGWIVAGLPTELRFITPPSDIVQRGVTEYGELPGAVFLLANGVVLPHGGVLFRLCGVYDEPGTVGTIAALCLAVTRFQVSNVRGCLSFLAGLMSLSLAFVVLAAIGLGLTALGRRRLQLLPLAALCLAVGSLPLSGFRFAQAAESRVTIVTSSFDAATSMPGGTSAVRVNGDFRFRYVPDPEWALRNAPRFDNRAHPRMQSLLGDYLESPPGSQLFGIAADASIVYGSGSSVWYRLLTDFGIVGFLWAFCLYSFPLVGLWGRRELEVGVLIFCALYLMSFYQRPIIWLPAQLLIYFAGIYAARNSESQRARQLRKDG